MGWLTQLNRQKVGLDTAPLIYYLEGHPTYSPLVKPFFQAFDKGKFSLVTSPITLVETTVHPLRQGLTALASRYEEILTHTKGLEVLDLSLPIAHLAAQLRANYNLRTPDAIQLATAIHGQATFFLTNDVDLTRVREIKVLTLNELLS